MRRVPVMLSIAGSDPSGGAGVQADLKAASALGVYGACVLTALTVQNTVGVTGVHAVPAAFVADQYRAVVTDLDVRAVKIGMLGAAETAAAVAGVLTELPVPHVVLDPVMIATSGDRLVPEETIRVIREELAPLCTVITPNLPETAALTGGAEPTDRASMIAAGRELLTLGPAAVLVKGGHLGGETSDDVLVTAGGVHDLPADRVHTPNTHGTGCTLSSAIAARLTCGDDLPTAVTAAKDYLTRALRAGAALEFGAGSGPVDHLWPVR